MKVKELIELLSNEDMDAEVRLGFQPGYPIEYGVGGVTSGAAAAAAEREAGVEYAEPAPERVVYVLEGDWLGRGRRSLWAAPRLG